MKTTLDNSKKVYKRLLGYVKPYWLALMLGVMGIILGSCIDALFTWMLKPLLDQGFIARNMEFIRWLPLGIIVGFLLRGVAGFIADYFITWVGRNVVMQLRQQIFSHLLKLPAEFYDKNSSGQLLSTIIYNTEQVASACTDSMVMLVRETFLVVGLITVMLINSWQLTFLFLVTLPVLAAIARYSSRRIRRLSHQVQNVMADVTHVAEESIEGYRVIRMFGGEAYEQEKFRQATLQNQRQEMKVIATTAYTAPTVQMLAGILIAITLYMATSPHTMISAGAFTSIIAAMLALLKPMRNLTNVNTVLQKGIAGAHSIFELLDQLPEIDKGTKHIARVKGAIEYAQVNFAYQADKKILTDINFKVEPGQVVALVGHSGGGKSTLVNLLPRFYDNYTGHISIDGIDIQAIHLADLRRQFALVSQHITLFNDNIARNIAYGCAEQVTEQQIIEAAEAAHAMVFIKDLPEGLNTYIGENGVRLSGGQRQRIAIARALLKNAPILILDEATSALDTESERHIQEAMEELKKHRTTLVIAHRLSTVEKADLIIVLEQGRIVEMGKHEKLIQQQGTYAKLHAMQFKDG